MGFITCVNCLNILIYLSHIFTGVKCSSDPDSPNPAQLRAIELSLDHSVDPCDDFYAHACNNWTQQHPDQSYDEVTGLVDSKVNKRLIDIIESAYQEHHQVTNQFQTFVEKTQIYYKSCINEKARNIGRYFELIDPVRYDNRYAMGQFQRNGQNNQRQKRPTQQINVFALLGRLQSYGFNNVLINQKIVHHRNGSLQIMLKLPSATADDKLQAPVLRVLLEDCDFPEFPALSYSRNFIKTQERWHNIYQNYSQTLPDTDNSVKLSYTELEQQYPQLHTFLEHVMPQQMRPDDYVVIVNLDYFDFLLNKEWQPKEPQYLSDYLTMKFLAYLVKDSTNDLSPLACIKDLRNKMGIAVNYLYYEHIYPVMGTRYSDDIKHLSIKISKYFMETLNENTLNLTEQQLQELEDQIQSLTVNLGNLPANLQSSPIEEFYKDVPAMEQQNYYKNHLELLKHRFRKSILYNRDVGLFMPRDNRVGSSSAPYNITKQHAVILPLGFLLPPIYDYYYHPLLTWSLFGFLLARGFTNAVDTKGQLYGNDGYKLVENPSVFENLNLKCMQAQQPTDAIDGRLADLMGARVAYKAYLTENQEQLQPKFTDISWKKLFFLNMAQFFCGGQGIQSVHDDADAVRLGEIVKNVEGFAEAFNCSRGSAMNPEQKCRLYLR